MKKAKIMLIAIAVLAVAGGALAFKAGTNSKPFLCYTTEDPGTGGLCAFATQATITGGTPDINAFYSTEQVVGDPDVFCTTIDCSQFGQKPFKIDP